MSLPWKSDAERALYLPAPEEIAYERQCIGLLMKFLTEPVPFGPKDTAHIRAVWRCKPDEPTPDKATVLCGRTEIVLGKIGDKPEKYLAGDREYIQGARFMIAAVINLANIPGEIPWSIKKLERMIYIWPLFVVLTDEVMMRNLFIGKDALPPITKVGSLCALNFAQLVVYSDGKGYQQAQRVVDELAILGLELQPYSKPPQTNDVGINTLIFDPLIVDTLKVNGITSIDLLLQYTYNELQSFGCNEPQAIDIVLSLAKHGYLLKNAIEER